MERFVHVILRKLGPYVLRTGENTQFGVYPFRCKVYVHCIHFVYGHSGVDSIRFAHFARCVYVYCLHFTYI